MVKRRKFRMYDEDVYTNFGEQPAPFEIQLGYGLIPLVDESKESNLQRQINYCRNQIDAEYGLPIPTVHIRDNMCLEPYEYSILFNGVEVGKSYVRLGYHLCIDSGSVTSQLDCSFCDKTKEPAFGMDAFWISDEEYGKYNNAGYVCVPPEKVMGTHLSEIIRKNRTRILNQNMVCNLIDKVRKSNPDVISDVFFNKGFKISDMKTVLNQLLAEEVSIRDMNTILETVADYLGEEKSPVLLEKKVRERLALSIIQKYADENKTVHVIRLSEKATCFLADHIYFPSSKVEAPYFALEPIDRKKLTESLSYAIKEFAEKNHPTVFLCVADIRMAFFNTLKKEFPGIYVISDKEMYEVKDVFAVQLEGELSLDE